MKQAMLNLQELSVITGKSSRTLRRVVKLSDQIKTGYIQTKLVANLDDVLAHYWIAYPSTCQTVTQLDKQQLQLQDGNLNTQLTDSIIKLTQQLSTISFENTAIQKALVSQQEQYWKKLILLEYQYQNIGVEHNKLQTLRSNRLKTKSLTVILFCMFFTVAIIVVGHYSFLVK